MRQFKGSRTFNRWDLVLDNWLDKGENAFLTENVFLTRGIPKKERCVVNKPRTSPASVSHLDLFHTCS